jgi:hypothetical protein
MILAAATLTAALSLEIDLGALFKANRARAPKVTCGIRTVGYRFSGKPGQMFRYAGDTYTIPAEGWIELIADRRSTTYRINNETLPLEGFPLNQFSFGEVPLPESQPTVAEAVPEKETTR